MNYSLIVLLYHCDALRHCVPRAWQEFMVVLSASPAVSSGLSQQDRAQLFLTRHLASDSISLGHVLPLPYGAFESLL